MSSLISNPSRSLQGLSALPDISQGFSSFASASRSVTARPAQPVGGAEPEQITFPEAVPISRVGLLNAVKLDAAVALNRSNTPDAIGQLRQAPRYSLRELNDLSAEQLSERLSKISGTDNRPGWVKALDIIDMPRNFMANIITETFLPEARRMALERGEFDQAGQVKVFGSDMLRAMGVQNHVVNAIGGFAIDIFTDPLSFLGGPIGGLKTAGTRGSVAISTSGRRTLNSAINSVSKGTAVSEQTTRTLINTTLAHGVASDAIKAGASNVDKATYLRDTIFGSVKGVSRAGEKVGFGKFSRGGTLAEDFYRVAKDGMDVTEVARINGVKGFVSKHSNNGILNFTKGKGGAEIAHVPFSSTLSLTVPSFKIPGIGHRFGQQAELQMAVAKAVSGKPQSAAVIARSVGLAAESNHIARSMENNVVELDRLRLAGGSVDGAAEEALQFTIKTQAGRIAGIRDELKAVRNAIPTAELNTINDIPTLLATQDALDDARLAVDHAEAQMRFSDIKAVVPRVTRTDIAAANKEVEMITKEAAARKLADPEQLGDALIDTNRQEGALDDLITSKVERSQERFKDLVQTPDDIVDMRGQVADAFGTAMEASISVATSRGVGISRAMSNDQRLVAQMAKRLNRLSLDDTGALPLASIAAGIRHIGFASLASRVDKLGKATAVHLGGVSGTMSDASRVVRNRINGAEDVGNRIADEYVVGIEEAIRNSKSVTGGQIDIVSEAAGLMLEQQVYAEFAQQFPSLATQYSKSSAAGKALLDTMKKTGILQDKELLAKLDELAVKGAAQFKQWGLADIRAGRMDSLSNLYVPLIFKQEAARRARIARTNGQPSEAVRLGSSAGPSALDPTKRRVTNMVEFKDLKGNTRSFTVAEGMNYGVFDERRAAAMVEAGQTKALQRYKEISEHVDEFKKVHRVTHTPKGTTSTLEDLMQRESRSMLPSEANEYAAQGYLDPFTGGALAGDKAGRVSMFEMSLPVLIAERAKAYEVAAAKESLRDIVEPFVVMEMRANDVNKLVAGEKAVLGDGQVGQFLGDGRLKVNDTIYVHMDSIQSKFPEGTLFNPDKILGGDIGRAFIPETLATEMLRTADTLTPVRAGEVMQFAEKITSLFRTTTLLHPSWTGTNIVGNTILAVNMGLMSSPKRAARFARMMKDATLMHMRRNLDDSTTLGRLGAPKIKLKSAIGTDPNATKMINGAPMKVKDIFVGVDAAGIAGKGSGLHADTMESMISPLISGGADKGRSLGKKFKNEKARVQSTRSNSTRVQNGADTVAAGMNLVPVAGVKKVVRGWFRANAMVDDVFRTAAYMMLLDDGVDAVTAGVKTRRGMLNFGDMTSFEKNNLRPLIPFYSWLRASAPAYIMKSIKDPKILSEVPKLREALEQALAGDDRLPRHMRPRWLQETMAIQIGTDPETRRAFLAGTLIPQESAIQLATGIGGVIGSVFGPEGDLLDFDGQDFLESMQYLGGQLSPSVRTPIELATMKTIFSQREIGIKEGEGEITLNDYLLNTVRPVKEFGLGLRRGKAGEAFERSTAEGVQRLLLGGRIQPGLQEDRRQTALYFDLKDREAELRKGVKLAEKQGDDDAVAKRKFELLSEYKRFAERGGEISAIPKWAIQDLEAFGFTPPAP